MSCCHGSVCHLSAEGKSLSIWLSSNIWIYDLFLALLEALEGAWVSVVEIGARKSLGDCKYE